MLLISRSTPLPTFVTQAGVTLVESDYIVQYLISLVNDKSLIPADAEQYSAMLHRQGLAKGMMDCAFSVTIRRRFGDADDSPLTRRWLEALPRATAALETASRGRPSGHEPDLGDLAVAVALSYCDLRIPELSWRTKAPALALQADRLMRRPSVLATAYH